MTNTRKVKTVQIYKVDDSASAAPLEGVEFTLNGETLTTDETGYTEFIYLVPSETAYDLAETTPKEHYTGLAASVPVTVSV